MGPFRTLPSFSCQTNFTISCSFEVFPSHPGPRRARVLCRGRSPARAWGRGPRGSWHSSGRDSTAGKQFRLPNFAWNWIAIKQVTVHESSMSIDLDKFNKQVVGKSPDGRCFPLRILSYVLEFWRPLFDTDDMPKSLSVCVWAPRKLLRVKSNRISPSGQRKHGRGFGGPRSRDASNDSRRSGGGASSRHSSRGSSAARPVEAPSPSPHPPEIREGLSRWCGVG